MNNFADTGHRIHDTTISYLVCLAKIGHLWNYGNTCGEFGKELQLKAKRFESHAFLTVDYELHRRQSITQDR